MKVIREICVSGKVIDVTVKVPSGNHSGRRGSRKVITSEKVQKNNDRISAKKVTRIVNANFKVNDWHDTLTYRNEPTAEVAMRYLNNFISRMRRAMKKLNIEFKWLVATEYIGERLHHHFITNAPLDLVRQKWNEGLVLPRPLDQDPNYRKLGDYIIKETAKSFREADSPFNTRYSHSRNLVIPYPQVEEVEDRQLWDEPVAWKGYYIDQDTVRRYEHPITGLPHLEYQMISLSDKPRIKKYYKGRIKFREENYNRYVNYTETQLDLFNFDMEEPI